MQLGKALRNRLAEGEAVVGSWLALSDCGVAEIMSRAGFDFLVIDLEHSPTSVESAAAMIRVIDLAGCSPLVRLPEFSPTLAKQVLDAGAHGIIVPDVDSAALAHAVVRSTRYPPSGDRGVGLHRAQGYGTTFQKYFEAADDSLLVVVQIESAAGVTHIGEIASIDGIDAVMIGPYDLSVDLGMPGDFKSGTFTKAVRQVIDGARAEGVATGIHVVEPDPAALRASLHDGHRFLVYSVDMRIVDVGARLGAQAIGIPS